MTSIKDLRAKMTIERVQRKKLHGQFFEVHEPWLTLDAEVHQNGTPEKKIFIVNGEHRLEVTDRLLNGRDHLLFQWF